MLPSVHRFVKMMGASSHLLAIALLVGEYFFQMANYIWCSKKKKQSDVKAI